MTGILLSKGFVAQFGAELKVAAKSAGITLDIIHLPDDATQRLPETEIAKIEAAYLTRDIRFSDHYHGFGDTVKVAPNLKWVHFTSTGIDQHPFLPALHQRKVRLTTSAGTNGEPVGQTAICGLLMLARGFPRWLAAQRERRWDPARGKDTPRDLGGQTVIVVGLGTIGATVARFCQALGMKVIGLRRSPKRDGDPVDEMHTLDQLPALLPRCDWLVLACPYTKETHQLVNAATLALMPKHAHLVNVARGAVADEKALIAALQSKQIAGAYLDVFEKEPLPADSPLWDIPNVIVSPHNASASGGNDGRAARVFTENLKLYVGGKPMVNEQG
ncbi:MAG: D-2-hydroxyacid dehydrogenase [Betaproteobacteria bacterium]|jgi:phosphoglycerate dehydrogenase-like enzyme|nr:D-2-hydroxyacid dehydrogenase [Betaproteobacteria bacterium]MDH5341418.1 D-2-hydroxyacid dehydrogenase [Betaproteobacteria bacterium]